MMRTQHVTNNEAMDEMMNETREKIGEARPTRTDFVRSFFLSWKDDDYQEYQHGFVPLNEDGSDQKVCAQR